MKVDHPSQLDPRFLAGVQLIERTGARMFRIGWSDDDDGPPVVWYATAEWGLDPSTGRPLPKGGRIRAEAAAAMTPLGAVLRLCERIIDGGECTHCGRRTIFIADHGPAGPLDTMGCVYQWDPELATFRRNCEGDD